jgi:hypothetical protein
MSAKINTAAWDSDPFWKEVVNVITGGRKLRADSYLQRLTAEELEQLQLCLSLPASLEEQQKRAPKVRGGSRDGEAPGIKLLSELGQAIRQTEMLRGLERQQVIELAAKERCGQLGLNSSLTNAVVTILGEEALRQSALGVVDKFSLKAAAVLIKREEQQFEQEKYKESMRTKLESGLAELAQHIKGDPKARAAYDAFKATIAASTK